MGSGVSIDSPNIQSRMVDLEIAILEAICEVRKDPSICIRRLESKLSHFNINEFDTGTGIIRVTKEGQAAVINAIRHLNTITKTSIVDSVPSNLNIFSNIPSIGLSLAAEDHAYDIGLTGATSHKGSDLSSPAERQNRYGSWSGACSECIWYGRLSSDILKLVDDTTSNELTNVNINDQAISIVDDLIIDDGVPDRGHRLIILDKRYCVGGVGLAKHVVFGHCIVVEFASAFIAPAEGSIENEKYLRLCSRKINGPLIQSQKNQDREAEKAQTQWKSLGICYTCKVDIKGGRVVNGDKKKVGVYLYSNLFPLVSIYL